MCSPSTGRKELSGKPGKLNQNAEPCSGGSNCGLQKQNPMKEAGDRSYKWHHAKGKNDDERSRQQIVPGKVD